MHATSAILACNTSSHAGCLDFSAAVREHNVYRDNHGAPNLVADKALTDSAQVCLCVQQPAHACDVCTFTTTPTIMRTVQHKATPGCHEMV